LSDEEIIAVKSELRFRQFAKREVVLQKGGAGDSLLFLLSGQLQVIDVTEDGRAIGLRMLAPGDFFGEIAVINNSTRSASVVAMTEVLVAFLPPAPPCICSRTRQPRQHAAPPGAEDPARPSSAPCSASTTPRAASTPSWC
jgi:hypothetical protein